MINLANSDQAPALIDSVDLVTDRGASPVRLAKALIAPPDVVQHVGRIHAAANWPAAAGYCLPATADAEAPVLALRVGPSAPAQVAGHQFSRNNAVNVHYRTSDGQRYVAVFPVRIEYPNHPGRSGTSAQEE
ncbi:hypothetical protein [Nocardioides sp. HB32]